MGNNSNLINEKYKTPAKIMRVLTTGGNKDRTGRVHNPETRRITIPGGYKKTLQQGDFSSKRARNMLNAANLAKAYRRKNLGMKIQKQLETILINSLLNEDKVKRELRRSQDAMNKMFSGKLSNRSRIAKKQRKIAMGPMAKVSVNTSDREDSQTMLNMKDKIAETLLNSFNELLNERSPQSRQNKAKKNKIIQDKGELAKKMVAQAGVDTEKFSNFLAPQHRRNPAPEGKDNPTLRLGRSLTRRGK